MAWMSWWSGSVTGLSGRESCTADARDRFEELLPPQAASTEPRDPALIAVSKLARRKSRRPNPGPAPRRSRGWKVIWVLPPAVPAAPEHHLQAPVRSREDAIPGVAGGAANPGSAETRSCFTD